MAAHVLVSDDSLENPWGLPILHKLEVDAGRYRNIPADKRYCFSCEDKVEDEIHFLFECPIYAEIRNKLISSIENYEHFTSLSKLDQFSYLCQNNTRQIAKYVCQAYSVRNSLLYSNN